MPDLTTVAIDLGAESGRVMGVRFDGKSLALDEVVRFPNHPVRSSGRLYWNVLGLWEEIVAGLDAAASLKPASIGVDAWGVDYALLDATGELTGMPAHHRDPRTDGVPARVFSKVPRREVFRQTGIQIIQINTLYQLFSMVEESSAELETASTLLTIPDLFNYWLTGSKVCEYTNATTTQLFDTSRGKWADDLLTRLEIPTNVLPEVVDPGTKLGQYEGIPVIVPACHDTGSAVAGVPATRESFAYISSGTWSLAGLEIDEPIITDAALEANLTNEGGVFGTIRLLKNVMGLWIVQQCRETWLAEGKQYSYRELTELANVTEPLRSVVAVNDQRFLAHGDHPARIREFCRESGQPVPESPGEIVRAVLESLAMAYRDVFDKLVAVSGRSIEVIHIVGGGSDNPLLNQMTADVTGKLVLAGPREATVLGNGLVQLIALGELRNLEQARQMMARMDVVKSYEPRSSAAWDEAFDRYRKLEGSSLSASEQTGSASEA